MQDVDPLLQLTQIIQDVGIWAVFLYLFIAERKSHAQTRLNHMADLREIAGMRVQLHRAPDEPSLG